MRLQLKDIIKVISGFAIVAGFIIAPFLYAVVILAGLLGLNLVLYARLLTRVENVLSHFRKHTDA